MLAHTMGISSYVPYITLSHAFPRFFTLPHRLPDERRGGDEVGDAARHVDPGAPAVTREGGGQVSGFRGEQEKLF